MGRKSIYERMTQTGKIVVKEMPGVYSVRRQVKGRITKKEYGVYSSLGAATKAHPNVLNGARKRKVRRSSGSSFGIFRGGLDQGIFFPFSR